MNPKPSPLKCRSYYVTDLIVNANPKYNPAKPTRLEFRDLIVDAKTEQPENEDVAHVWRVFLKISQNVEDEKNTPYNFTVSLFGSFDVAKDYPQDKVQSLVEINGASILYSVGREVLRVAMGHGPYRPLFLPTVSFVQPQPPPVKVVAGNLEVAPPQLGTSG